MRGLAEKVAGKWQAVISISPRKSFATHLYSTKASDGIRTRDLSITNRLHYLCATLAKAEVVRECENGSFAMTIYREAASRIGILLYGDDDVTTT